MDFSPSLHRDWAAVDRRLTPRESPSREKSVKNETSLMKVKPETGDAHRNAIGQKVKNSHIAGVGEAALGSVAGPKPSSVSRSTLWC
jgi:hypothetical protein